MPDVAWKIRDHPPKRLMGYHHYDRAIQTRTTMTTPRSRMTIHSIRMMTTPVTDDTGMPTTVSADAAVNFCEACLVAPRDTRIALVLCGHQRFSESCANEVHNQGRGCPLCCTPIDTLLVNLCLKITLRRTVTKNMIWHLNIMFNLPLCLTCVNLCFKITLPGAVKK